VTPSAVSKFSFNRADEERTQRLWRWANDFIEHNPTIKKERLLTLAEMASMKDSDKEPREDRDITVMVTGKYLLPDNPTGINPRGFLRIWDGTGQYPSDP
jgi:hypothetical protein